MRSWMMLVVMALIGVSVPAFGRDPDNMWVGAVLGASSTKSVDQVDQRSMTRGVRIPWEKGIADYRCLKPQRLFVEVSATGTLPSGVNISEVKGKVVSYLMTQASSHNFMVMKSGTKKVGDNVLYLQVRSISGKDTRESASSDSKGSSWRWSSESTSGSQSGSRKWDKVNLSVVTSVDRILEDGDVQTIIAPADRISGSDRALTSESDSSRFSQSEIYRSRRGSSNYSRSGSDSSAWRNDEAFEKTMMFDDVFSGLLRQSTYAVFRDLLTYFQMTEVGTGERQVTMSEPVRAEPQKQPAEKPAASEPLRFTIINE